MGRIIDSNFVKFTAGTFPRNEKECYSSLYTYAAKRIDFSATLFVPFSPILPTFPDSLDVLFELASGTKG